MKPRSASVLLSLFIGAATAFAQMASTEVLRVWNIKAVMPTVSRSM
ncbi:MAG: hypothetical protein IPI55_11035 [Flavobacteriales bacterium]|nr:hypothetical protein [Flavobacteriales bacterium]